MCFGNGQVGEVVKVLSQRMLELETHLAEVVTQVQALERAVGIVVVRVDSLSDTVAGGVR
jgi:DNA-binding FrmR family transcriptional regulator